MRSDQDLNQRKIKGVEVSTIVQIPNTEEARLLKNLLRVEPSLARMTGYAVKIVEQAGIQLNRLFTRVSVPKNQPLAAMPILFVLR